MEEHSLKKPILFAGTGRSGTTFLGRILAQDHRIFLAAEIRYVWNDKHGDLRYDFRASSDAMVPVKQYILISSSSSRSYTTSSL